MEAVTEAIGRLSLRRIGPIQEMIDTLDNFNHLALTRTSFKLASEVSYAASFPLFLPNASGLTIVRSPFLKIHFALTISRTTVRKSSCGTPRSSLLKPGIAL
jgi:hypothetical protein